LEGRGGREEAAPFFLAGEKGEEGGPDIRRGKKREGGPSILIRNILQRGKGEERRGEKALLTELYSRGKEKKKKKGSSLIQRKRGKKKGVR